MSAPQSFADLPAALAAYVAGQCRRWVRVDGWQIDLVKAQAEAGRVREEPAAIKPAPLYDRALVAKNIAAELARTSEVLPELAVPSDVVVSGDGLPRVTITMKREERCPWCGREEVKP